jgi:SH3-like domain-containing protein
MPSCFSPGKLLNREQMKKILYLAVLLVFLGVTAAHAKTMSIAEEEVNVRVKPTSKAEVLYKAHRGYPVLVRKRQQNWLYVEDWNGKKGWVYAKGVSSVPTIIVESEWANIRKGPSQKDAVIAKGTQGEIYKVLAEKHNWVKIGYYFEKGSLGWINKEAVWGY